MGFDFTILFIAMPAILFALTFHEYAHAWAAWKLGDPTARSMGRLSLNPLVHLDPAGTIMLVITVMSGFGIGWAKPVPVDPRYLRNPRKDMLWIALAGPVSNIILAFILVGVFTHLPSGGALTDTLRQMIRYGIVINLALAFFNMLPIPPLDGSRVLRGLLPPAQAHRFGQLEMYGPMLLIGLIVADQMLRLGIIRTWIAVPAQISLRLMSEIFSSF